MALKKKVLITGASRGIGRSILEAFSDENSFLIGTATSKVGLDTIQNFLSENKIEGKALILDLGKEESINNFFTTLKDNDLYPDVLINNAGYGIADQFHETSVEVEEKFITVLGTSVITLTKLFIGDMLKRGTGQIMIVSSVAAFAPPSTIQVLYGPIKTFMNRFSDAINVNYKHKGISSTALCPGYTVTEFHTASGTQEQMDKVPGFLKLDARRVAREGILSLIHI